MRDRTLRRGLTSIAREIGARLEGGGHTHYRFVAPDGRTVLTVGGTPACVERTLKLTRKQLTGRKEAR